MADLAGLKQALTEAAGPIAFEMLQVCCPENAAFFTVETVRSYVADALSAGWPLVVAAVVEARKDEREKVAQAIEAEREVFRRANAPFYESEIAALALAARLARGSVPVKEQP